MLQKVAQIYSFGYGLAYVCVFTREIFSLAFHEFRSEMGVFDGAEHDADISSSSLCHFARFLELGFFCVVLPIKFTRAGTFAGKKAHGFTRTIIRHVPTCTVTHMSYPLKFFAQGTR